MFATDESGTRELSQRFERVGLPYAPITQPHELFDDPHLLATGGLAPITVPADGSGAGRAIETRSPLLPLSPMAMASPCGATRPP